MPTSVKLLINRDEFTKLLTQIPRRLRDEARPHVQQAAEHALETIREDYPVVTGNLRKGLQLEDRSSEFAASYRVKNKAPHAWLYENGTEATRFYKGQSRGRMPGAHIFVKTAMRFRRLMIERLKQLLREEGFVVD